MATKEMRALLLTAGTAFLSGGIMLIGLGKYIEATLLTIIGIAAFYVREITKEEEKVKLKNEIMLLKREMHK